MSLANGVLSKNFLLKGVIIIVKNLSWVEFEKHMDLIFKKNFKIVDELYFNVVKQIIVMNKSVVHLLLTQVKFMIL